MSPQRRLALKTMTCYAVGESEKAHTASIHVVSFMPCRPLPTSSNSQIEQSFFQEVTVSYIEPKISGDHFSLKALLL